MAGIPVDLEITPRNQNLRQRVSANSNDHVELQRPLALRVCQFYSVHIMMEGRTIG